MKSYELLLVENGPTYESERLVLRAMELRDASDMFEYTSDPEVTKFITVDTQTDIEETKNGIAMYFLSAPIGKYALELKSTGKMIGAIDLRIDKESRSAEIGYVLNRAYQGQGYMTEAGKTILKIAFEILDLNLVFSRHNIDNPASGKVMQRLGMTHEGVLKGRELFKGDIIDTAYYSIEKKVYNINREEKEQLK